MSEDRLDPLLRAVDADLGCDAGGQLVDAYVELELAGEDPVLTYPGVAAHLRACAACRADHDGLLEAARLFGAEPPAS